ncbi:MAG: MltA domain-containing protein [Hyphomicrobium sp.]
MRVFSEPVQYVKQGLRGCAAGLVAGLVAGLLLAQAVQAGSSVAIITPAKPTGEPMPSPQFTYAAATFADLPGWDEDDHLAAWKAFLASCTPVLTAARGGAKAGPTPQALLDVCELALLTQAAGGKQTKAGARAFFESYFTPHSVQHGATEGLLTGYYEPLVQGSRQPGDGFTTPIYKRPPDLVNVVAESERGAKSAQFTHMRKTEDGLVPYLTRAEIEQGALKGQHLELMYFRDPVDVFFMQIQGSARIALPDGTKVRITYDGKNGYPYTSVGRMLIDDGSFTPEKMSLKALTSWLKADRKRGEQAMWQNKSYVFFRELQGAESEGAMGVLKIALQPGRSLAVDTAFHSIGMPIYVSSPALTHASTNASGFARLMVAHDVGSAIKGPERGDIFFGSGDKAGRTAGVTKHPGQFFVLLPSAARGEQMIARQRP